MCIACAISCSQADGITDLKAWSNPRNNIKVYAVIIGLAFFTSYTLAALLLWGVYSELRTMARSCFSPLNPIAHSGLIMEHPLIKQLPEGEEGSHRAAAMQHNMHEQDGSSDEEAPTAEGGPLAALKRKYEMVVGIALLAQNLLDDVAVVYEKIHGLFSWTDMVSTSLLVMVLVVLTLLLWFLGLPVLFMAIGLFLLRPPKYRDPLPTDPEAFYERLPIALIDKAVINKIIQQHQREEQHESIPNTSVP